MAESEEPRDATELRNEVRGDGDVACASAGERLNRVQWLSEMALIGLACVPMNWLAGYLLSERFLPSAYVTFVVVFTLVAVALLTWVVGYATYVLGWTHETRDPFTLIPRGGFRNWCIEKVVTLAAVLLAGVLAGAIAMLVNRFGLPPLALALILSWIPFLVLAGVGAVSSIKRGRDLGLHPIVSGLMFILPIGWLFFAFCPGQEDEGR